MEGLHTISGTCDLCGEACDANTQELNVLSCTFKNCEDLPYHQDCLEKVGAVGAGHTASEGGAKGVVYVGRVCDTWVSHYAAAEAASRPSE